MGAAAFALLGHRPDYVGHFLAGLGATLGLILFGRLIGLAVDGWLLVAVVAFSIALGIGTEASIFKKAIFDPVDLCNQSLGACVAGAVAYGRSRATRTTLSVGAVASLALVLGFRFAFA